MRVPLAKVMASGSPVSMAAIPSGRRDYECVSKLSKPDSP
jgi:hypothetical protein